MWRTTLLHHIPNGGKRGFQSTSPVWRTTPHPRETREHTRISIHVPRVEDDRSGGISNQIGDISIHVPRVEDDRYPRGSGGYMRYFNPRPPCGGRREENKTMSEKDKFQSTSPVWRTTPVNFIIVNSIKISIHVPRVEDDNFALAVDVADDYFNPRPPCGGRRPSLCRPTSINHFNPRPPCGGRPSTQKRRRKT